MKAMLVQCAHNAGRTKGTYLRDKYYKLKTRRGVKRAAVAIGHKILVIAYFLIKLISVDNFNLDFLLSFYYTLSIRIKSSLWSQKNKKKSSIL